MWQTIRPSLTPTFLPEDHTFDTATSLWEPLWREAPPFCPHRAPLFWSVMFLFQLSFGKSRISSSPMAALTGEICQCLSTLRKREPLVPPKTWLSVTLSFACVHMIDHSPIDLSPHPLPWQMHGRKLTIPTRLKAYRPTGTPSRSSKPLFKNLPQIWKHFGLVLSSDPERSDPKLPIEGGCCRRRARDLRIVLAPKVSIMATVQWLVKIIKGYNGMRWLLNFFLAILGCGLWWLMVHVVLIRFGSGSIIWFVFGVLIIFIVLFLYFDGCGFSVSVQTNPKTEKICQLSWSAVMCSKGIQLFMRGSKASKIDHSGLQN